MLNLVPTMFCISLILTQVIENKNNSSEGILTFCVVAQCRVNLATYLPSQLLVKILCHQILKVHTFTWKKQKPLLPTLVILVCPHFWRTVVLNLTKNRFLEDLCLAHFIFITSFFLILVTLVA